MAPAARKLDVEILQPGAALLSRATKLLGSFNAGIETESGGLRLRKVNKGNTGLTVRGRWAS